MLVILRGYRVEPEGWEILSLVIKLPAELNAVKTYLRENFKRHPYLYSSSTIAAGSACSRASEKYSSRVGRKTLKINEKDQPKY